MSLTPEQKALARHRFDRAESTIGEAIDELSRRNFRLAVNWKNFLKFKRFHPETRG